MPFYTALKIKPADNALDQARKRRTAARLLRLRAAIQAHFTASGCNTDHGGSVKIATWNLREFGAGKYGGRDFECLYYIAEIVCHFDIVALQEVRANLAEFLQLLRILGPDWDYIATDVTDGDAGNGERMVFVFNRREVQFRNIAGELTLKEGNKIRAAFGERLKLENGLSVRLPDGQTLSGTYAARTRKAAADRYKLDADLELPLPPGASLELPPGCQLVVGRNTEIERAGRGLATLDIPARIGGGNSGCCSRPTPSTTRCASLRARPT